MILDEIMHMNGPDFLQLYAMVAASAVVLALLFRVRLGQAAAGSGPTPTLGMTELAYLAGGPARVADTVLVAMVNRGAALFDAATNVFTPLPGAIVPVAVQPFSPAVAQPMKRGEALRSMRPAIEALANRLAASGLAIGAERVRSYRLAACAVMAAPLVLGVAKAVRGATLGRPIGFLVVLLVLTVAVLLLLLTAPRRTRAGQAALKKAISRNARLTRAPRTEEMGLAFALLGAAVLAGTPLDAFGKTMSSSSDSSGGDSGGGGGDSGDSGGGDSGGGGGGCGGCSG